MKVFHLPMSLALVMVLMLGLQQIAYADSMQPLQISGDAARRIMLALARADFTRNAGDSWDFTSFSYKAPLLDCSIENRYSDELDMFGSCKGVKSKGASVEVALALVNAGVPARNTKNDQAVLNAERIAANTHRYLITNQIRPKVTDLVCTATQSSQKIWRYDQYLCTMNAVLDATQAEGDQARLVKPKKVEVTLTCDPASTGATQKLVFQYEENGRWNGRPNFVTVGSELTLVTQEKDGPPISEVVRAEISGHGETSFSNENGLRATIQFHTEKDAQGIYQIKHTGYFYRGESDPLKSNHCRE